MLICFGCDTVFEPGNLFDVSFCPVRRCHHDVADIDDNIFEAVRLLNRKGYETRFCCSGHSTDTLPRLYINFCGHIYFEDLPDGFQIEYSESNIENRCGGRVTTISRQYNRNQSNHDLQREIWLVCDEIIIWVKELPDFEDDFDLEYYVDLDDD